MTVYKIAVAFLLAAIMRSAAASTIPEMQWLPENCSYSGQCLSTYGSSSCVNHRCECDEGYYQVNSNESNKSYCSKCSSVQESCETSQCCLRPHATECMNGVCVCRPDMEDDCLSVVYRGRYSPTLGVQLANTLSLSFAFVFLAITFVAVIRKTLFNCGLCSCESLSRVGSNSSLNEFIKEKMQNRPPSYDEIEKDRKVPINFNQPPPAYDVRRPGRVEALRGVINRAFSISDEVDMNTAPPNYSTFTTVSNTTLRPTSSQIQNNNEVILTRAIYCCNSAA
ncbi:uncharacterized protein LOC126840168 isoform X2 [Adelges cooleyi]|uniref:uncharacterized protein LOC126840168 isoform X2 n=1 Tax=Adelges cooleyi TaxID=133065 RepID=UPI0021803AF5|nr:uncharacterized protein LOC126840168 isoform X2 [Adelges cooleyi]